MRRPNNKRLLTFDSTNSPKLRNIIASLNPYFAIRSLEIKQMSRITTHILDTRLGRPAAGVGVYLEKLDSSGGWQLIGSGTTNEDGRLATLLGSGTLTRGRHRMTFETGAYCERQQVEFFYPRVLIEFEIAASDQHYHVPLLLSPYGYSTYRGS
jgi:5-hydroxyisourate hydrolase